MLIPGEHISKTCFLLTVLLACVIFYAQAHDNQINFKLGFDLTEGENGGPSLRVREFEDSKEFNVRAEEKSGESKKPAARADSESADTSDDSSAKKNRDNSNESAAKSAVASDQSRDEDDEENSNESGGADKVISTKGPGDYEPKRVGARIHDQDVDSSEDRRRKREAGTFGHLKRKSKKFFAAENKRLLDNRRDRAVKLK